MVHETLAAVLEAGIRGFSVYGRLEAEDFSFCNSNKRGRGCTVSGETHLLPWFLGVILRDTPYSMDEVLDKDLDCVCGIWEEFWLLKGCSHWIGKPAHQCCERYNSLGKLVN
jgi:hypothetical protein